MEGSVLPNDSGMSSFLDMDFDFSDDMLMNSCLFQTPYTEQFHQQPDSVPVPLPTFDSPPIFLSSIAHVGIAPVNNSLQQEIPTLMESMGGSSSSRLNQNQNQFEAMISGITQSGYADFSKLGRTVPGVPGPSTVVQSSAGPCQSTDYYDPSSLNGRLMQALRYVKESSPEGDVLIQMWIPIKKGTSYYLTTLGQPFALDHTSKKLVQYRNISVNYLFGAEVDAMLAMGLPGRVFLGRSPEWTPDVQFYSRNEYPRVVDAYRQNVHGSIALPVFENGSRHCLGVVEVVTTMRKTNYGPEVDRICRAFQAVNLSTTELLSTPHIKVSNHGYKDAVLEIQVVLKEACFTHNLPIALTWISYTQQKRNAIADSDDMYVDYISTLDVACYVRDHNLLGFKDACSSHQLMKGQGMAGAAFLTNQPCFSPDVSSMVKSDYPLVHYAKLYGLKASVAIRLRSIYSGATDFVVEFFLPVNCIDLEEQKQLLHSLSRTIQQVCRGLRVVTDEELITVGRLRKLIRPDGLVSNASVGMDVDAATFQKFSPALPASWAENVTQASFSGRGIFSSAPLTGETSQPGNRTSASCSNQYQAAVKTEGIAHTQSNQDCLRSHYANVSPVIGADALPSSGSLQDKRRVKNEKSVSLDVLSKYFPASLKDAAKALGVCPTTLKRICRQHGISRWPSRKIKKVDHSIRKLQVVINSVGVEPFRIRSLYTNFPKASHGSSSQNLSHFGLFSPPPKQEAVAVPNAAPEAAPHQAASKSTPTCSQGSSSSHSFSNGTEPQMVTAPLVVKLEAMTEIAGAASVSAVPASGPPEPGGTVFSHSRKSDQPHSGSAPGVPDSCVTSPGNCARVKVVYGDEIVRFRIQPSMQFKDLQEEIAKRFRIEVTEMMELKYLDDDNEWVLLTCDADLQECIDVYRQSDASAIKLSVHQTRLPVGN